MEQCRHGAEARPPDDEAARTEYDKGCELWSVLDRLDGLILQSPRHRRPEVPQHLAAAAGEREDRA